MNNTAYIYAVKLVRKTTHEERSLPAKVHYFISPQSLFFCFCTRRRDHSPQKTTFAASLGRSLEAMTEGFYLKKTNQPTEQNDNIRNTQK